ncbi:hypothetical protein M8J76_007086 [Diaphorina citri]|nr:hypothetical protein M8J76_007086 [Diaphorina citri]
MEQSVLQPLDDVQHDEVPEVLDDGISVVPGPMPVAAPHGFQDYTSWFQELISGFVTNQEESTPPEPVKPVDLEKCGPCTCGAVNKKTRIVGGQVTYVHQYPWMALLMYKKRFYCGATLINNLYVLTAAHCVHQFDKKHITVRFLEHDRSTLNESDHIDRKVKWITKHRGYSTTTFNNDIALIRLEEELKYDDKLRPVCMPVKGKSFSNKTGIVTGWGVQKQGGSTSDTLLEVEVPILSNAECKKTAYENRITPNMLCAGYPKGEKDSCQGDSGGPLHYANETVHHIVGVVSWGEGCAQENYPGVYARVNRYLTWIKNNTIDACPCNYNY